MDANKHNIYLTKNHTLQGSANPSANVFMFNENGPLLQAKWVKKTIESNDGCFVILDHKNIILNEVEKGLVSRNYYIEKINFADMHDGVSINPFDLVTNTSEIHFMFLNLLYAMWDNTDPDIAAMSNLIDAFASCTYFMFQHQKAKLNMQTMRKMVYSVRANCQTEDGIVPMSDAIFGGINDQESMPCKYYAQFKRAAGERHAEIAEKVAQVFDMFSENDMEMMNKTDVSLIDSFNFKTAFFLNVERSNEEHSAKLMTILLNYFVQRKASSSKVMFVIDNLDARRGLISLPHWLKEAPEYNISFIVMNDNLAEFTATPRAEKYFRNLQQVVSASVLVHRNEDANVDNEDLNCVVRVLVPSEGTSEMDELF